MWRLLTEEVAVSRAEHEFLLALDFVWSLIVIAVHLITDKKLSVACYVVLCTEFWVCGVWQASMKGLRR